ncbi:hypothetical protein TNCV_3917211 [Trichonephila clavipes]|nr:hypothetical protein TNCV_3917211 [Trichonephila clavipes]
MKYLDQYCPYNFWPILQILDGASAVFQDPDTVLIRVESMIESTTNSNEFRSKDGTVVRILDADFNLVPRSVTKNTTPCSTRIRTTTICVNNQGLIGVTLQSSSRAIGDKPRHFEPRSCDVDDISELPPLQTSRPHRTGEVCTDLTFIDLTVRRVLKETLDFQNQFF